MSRGRSLIVIPRYHTFTFDATLLFQMNECEKTAKYAVIQMLMLVCTRNFVLNILSINEIVKLTALLF